MNTPRKLSLLKRNLRTRLMPLSLATLLAFSVFTQMAEAVSPDNPLLTEEERGGGGNENTSSLISASEPRTLRSGLSTSQSASRTVIRNRPNISAVTLNPDTILPFGYNLFSAVNVSEKRPGVNASYIVAPGDKITVNIWGAVTYDSVLTVDPQGNVFIPEVGPIAVGGVQASRVNRLIENQIRQVYRDNVEVYTNLSDRVPVSVFVTGAVSAPGRYEGYTGESVPDYLKKAGGPDLQRGSFREIQIKRGGRLIETYDLYDFLRNGSLPRTTLHEGDVIVVKERGDYVIVQGEANDIFTFELRSDESFGAALTEYARPLPGASHVLVSGVRDNVPFGKYISLAEFGNFELFRGDQVTYEKGATVNHLQISVSGWHEGDKRLVVPINTKLSEVLNNIPIDPEIARSDAIYIKRLSVAEKQKASVKDSVKRLQETLLLAGASGATAGAEARPIGGSEIQLLEKFISHAESLQPEGRVVVASGGALSDTALEDGDEIVIPKQSDLVSVNGEVFIPKSVVWQKGLSAEEYIEKSGGFTDNAKEDQIIILRANGETVIDSGATIERGDEIIVMPEVKINNLALAGQITDILYKSVLAVAIPLRF